MLIACEAILRRSGATLGWRLHAISFLGIMLLLWYFFYVERNLLARVYTQNFGYGLVLLVTAIVMGRTRSRRTIDRVLVWSLLLFAVHFFPRTLFTIGFSAPQSSPEAFGASAFWKMLQLSLGVFGAGLALTVLAATLTDAMDGLRDERDKDGLTGVLNRRGFEERTSRLRGRRRTDDGVLILCDLDRFKQINDTYGHSAGDAVLKAFGFILQGAVREHDIVGRIGGEEFALLLSDTDIFGARELSSRLRQEIKKARFAFLPEGRHITASFGIAEWHRGSSYRDAFSVADRRLYAAKRSGRDSVVATDDGAGAEIDRADRVG
ncbi:GGDEF domain-containing protein [Chelativorans xinjiangense]|uniref:GGDEF domain-containing protein n=1 Tax=Chelativorans xinjiangense TaxID=2681485 RepID=UPI001FE87036|nr:GGDEF domain-containing protein [Chelativorans xinjiangense]